MKVCYVLPCQHTSLFDLKQPTFVNLFNLILTLMDTLPKECGKYWQNLKNPTTPCRQWRHWGGTGNRLINALNLC